VAQAATQPPMTPLNVSSGVGSLREYVNSQTVAPEAAAERVVLKHTCPTSKIQAMGLWPTNSTLALLNPKKPVHSVIVPNAMNTCVRHSSKGGHRTA